MCETNLLDNLVMLPCRQDDVGSQRCWLGTSVMSRQSIMLYDVLKIECSNRLSFLCRTWPRLDNVGNSYIQFDGTVSAADVDQHEKVPDCVNDTGTLSVPVHNIQKVTYSVVESVSVSVVMDWKELVLCGKSSAEVLQCRIRNLLVGFVIAASHSLWCSRTTLGKLYCWNRIIFHNVVIKNSCSCGFITHSSEINVVEVMSKEQFEQRTQKAVVLGGLDSEINLLCSIVRHCQEYGLHDSSHKKVSISYLILEYNTAYALHVKSIHLFHEILILSVLKIIC